MPERESTVLSAEENLAFSALVTMATYNVERVQLSYALQTVTSPKALHVLDGFQRNAVKMWRP